MRNYLVNWLLTTDDRLKQRRGCALTWIAFVFGSNTWLEKWQLSHGFAVEHISWVLAHSCRKMQLSHGFRYRAEHIPLVSTRWKLGSLRQ